MGAPLLGPPLHVDLPRRRRRRRRRRRPRRCPPCTPLGCGRCWRSGCAARPLRVVSIGPGGAVPAPWSRTAAPARPSGATVPPSLVPSVREGRALPPARIEATWFQKVWSPWGPPEHAPSPALPAAACSPLPVAPHTPPWPEEGRAARLRNSPPWVLEF